MQIHIANRQKALPLHLPSVEEAVRVLLNHLGKRCEEVGLYFVTKRTIGALHRQFFDDPSPTDCITFPLDASYLGEIFVCPAMAKEYGQEHQIDPFQETLLYIAHGILHLSGYGDKTPQERKTMRKMEKTCMRHLKIKGISLDPHSH